RDPLVTGVQTCALPIWLVARRMAPPQNPRLQELTRRALHGRADGAALRRVRVVALGALGEIDLTPALGERVARRLGAAAGERGGEKDQPEARPHRAGLYQKSSGGPEWPPERHANDERPAYFVATAGRSRARAAS